MDSSGIQFSIWRVVLALPEACSSLLFRHCSVKQFDSPWGSDSGGSCQRAAAWRLIPQALPVTDDYNGTPGVPPTEMSSIDVLGIVVAVNSVHVAQNSLRFGSANNLVGSSCLYHSG